VRGDALLRAKTCRRPSNGRWSLSNGRFVAERSRPAGGVARRIDPIRPRGDGRSIGALAGLVNAPLGIALILLIQLNYAFAPRLPILSRL
jgi:hypothetical protein